jgi:hypothetical protein
MANEAPQLAIKSPQKSPQKAGSYTILALQKSVRYLRMPLPVAAQYKPP